MWWFILVTLSMGRWTQEDLPGSLIGELQYYERLVSKEVDNSLNMTSKGVF